MKAKRKRALYISKPILPWHSSQTRKDDWNYFVTLSQFNEKHVEEFGCRVCGTITFNSAFIHQREGFQVCLYHDASMVTLKNDWLPNGTQLRFKKKCSAEEDPLNYGRFLFMKKVIQQHEGIDY